jgi:radical SAM superfamily enzyme YgiQ (UPF0313 family)
LIYPEPDVAPFYLQSPIGCLYLAAALEHRGHAARIHDANVDPNPLSDVVDDFAPDVIGVSFTTGCVASSFSIARRFGNDGRVLMAGGIHPTYQPRECIEAGFDIVARGESEDTLPDVLENLGSSRTFVNGQRVPPGYFFEGHDGDFVDTGIARCEDVNRFVPARHLLPSEYHEAYSHGVLMGSRGCVFSCVFCASAATGFRERTPEAIVDELEYIIGVEDHKAVHFADDVFTYKPNWVVEICKEIVARGLEFCWSVNSRSDVPTCHWGMFDWMRRAGCEIVAFGVESGDQESLRASAKGLSISRAIPVLERAKSAGLGVRCNLIVGLPGATYEVHLHTIDLMERVLPDQIIVSLNTPYPGTAMGADPKRFGIRLKSHNWTTIFQNVYIDVDKFGDVIEYERITTDEIVFFVEMLLERLAPYGYSSVSENREKAKRPDRVVKTFLDRPKLPPLRDRAEQTDVYRRCYEPDWIL